MFIFAINGSPRNGRISTIINEVLESAKTNNHVGKVINLIDLDIKDCTGCMKSRKKNIIENNILKCNLLDNTDKLCINLSSGS